MTDTAATRAAAAQAFARALPAALAPEGPLQPESAVAAMARMAGTYYFRSFGYAALHLVPGQAVLSDEANQKGPELMHLTAEVLARIGLPLPDARVRAALDGSGGRHKPLLDFAFTQPRLERALAPIKAEYGLTHVEAGKAAACAVALLIHNAQQVLDPAIAFGIATYAFVEGSKTAPWPVTN
jgi:hypothetical protein